MAEQIPTSDDGPAPGELTAAGGTWRGLLFDNPRIDLPVAFYWTFEFNFEEIERDDDRVNPALSIDWVTGGPQSLRNMRGFEFDRTGWTGFEASVYFFEHYRYDSVRMAVVDQVDDRLRVTAVLSGDIDGLGPGEVRVDEWVDFTDIRVSCSQARSESEALALLSRHSDTDGLQCEVVGEHLYRFYPVS